MRSLIHKYFRYLLSRRPGAAKTGGFPNARKATVAIEFALIAPMLLLAVLGAAVFGIAVNNYITLTGAASIGARQLAISRGDSTPYTDTVNQIYGAAPNLTKAKLTITLSVNGTACATDAACATALNAAASSTTAVPGQVIASYPCSLVVMGTNFAPSCTLSANTTERVQ
ncbi:MAG: TadE/TadG family type IV pilus assembly protein [Methylocella sp.]